MTVLDEAEVRAILLKMGVHIKEIERMWVEKHGLRVVDWKVLKNTTEIDFLVYESNELKKKIRKRLKECGLTDEQIDCIVEG